MELVELAPKAPKDIRVRFNADEESAGDVMEAKEISFDYGTKPLIKNLSFLIRKDERVMFLGPNGSGKSTLMKLMNSMLVPKLGRITLGYNIKIGYYDQENRGLDDSKTVFEEMHDEYPEKNDLELRSTLALFLFEADDIDKKITTLSGGERARLTLAKLILKKVNLLIMDEPTNHLDIGSCEALESALIAFTGTIIAVSHDRYFINKVATRIIELDPTSDKGMRDYELESYDDAFNEYMRMRQIIKERNSVIISEAKTSDSKADYEERKRENAKKRGEERRIKQAQEKIPKLEERLSELEEELFGDASSNYIRAAEIEEEKAKIEEELLELYELVM
jgi:ATP-binding cassette subfamily F protein 3